MKCIIDGCPDPGESEFSAKFSGKEGSGSIRGKICPTHRRLVFGQDPEWNTKATPHNVFEDHNNEDPHRSILG